MESHNAVVATWLLSFQHIQQDNYLASEYLFFPACIAPQNIPRSIFPPASSEIEQGKALGMLTGYAFLTERGDSDYYDVHPLIHRVTQSWLKDNSMWSQVARKTVERLRQLIPYGGHEQSREYPAYLPHGMFTVKITETADEVATIQLLRRIGRCRQSLGEYSHAVSTYREVLARRTRVSGLRKAETLQSMAGLGSALSFQGKYAEAEQIQRNVLQLSRTALGKDHTLILYSVNKLAKTLKFQGKHVEAEQLHREALQLIQRMRGKEHPQTLISMNNLALMLHHQGKYVEAEQINREVLQLRQTILGDEHPDTLTSMSNLAWVRKCQGDTTEALDLMTSCARLSDKILGSEHPRTLRRCALLTKWRTKQQPSENTERSDSQSSDIIETRPSGSGEQLETLTQDLSKLAE